MVRFSFIVPVYNVEDYLPECMDSMLNQSCQDFEILVVDDVSTDGSRSIAEDYARRFPDKVRLIVHQRNTRQGGARNTGIQAARGRFLLFIDSDDYIHRDMLQLLSQALEESGADIVEFSYDLVSQTGAPLSSFSFAPRMAAVDNDISKPLLISTMGPCNKVYRASLFADPSLRFPENHFYEDYCLVPRLILAANRVHYISQSLYYYRQRNASTIRTTNVQRNLDIMVCTDILIAYFQAHTKDPQVLLQLEHLAVEHVLLHATLRVFSVAPRSPIVAQLLQYVQNRFPDYPRNPYRHVLSARYRRLLGYIEGRNYPMLYLQWNLRNRISGAVKKLLGK